MTITLVVSTVYPSLTHFCNFPSGAFDPSKIDYGDVMKIGFMLNDVLLLDEAVQVNGVEILLDCGEFGKEHVLMFNRDLLGKCAKCWQVMHKLKIPIVLP